CARWYFDYW
nr:immunoglobulin heavy chain junction region [Mus musculus]MBK4197025.1 immunoglobulin heavy chain junction region [Mus musculus]MBK4197026.1 immunoglobulin heavy chain junction region [Mus musculus]